MRGCCGYGNELSATAKGGENSWPAERRRVCACAGFFPPLMIKCSNMQRSHSRSCYAPFHDRYIETTYVYNPKKHSNTIGSRECLYLESLPWTEILCGPAVQVLCFSHL